MKLTRYLLAAVLCFLPLCRVQAQQTITQSAITRKIAFLLVDPTYHILGVTGATPVVTLSKNGAAFAAPAGAVTETGNGWYVLTATSADTGTLGPLVLHAQAFTSAPGSGPAYGTAATTGGLLPASTTYFGVLTYTNAQGETTATAQTSFTTGGGTATNTQVITSPSASLGAVSWRYYAGTVTGGPYYLQATNAVGTNYTFGVSAYSTAGTNPPGSNTAAYTDPCDKEFNVVAANLDSGTNLGLTALPSAAPNASGGFITNGTGAGQLNPNGNGGLPGLTTLLTGTAVAGSTSTTINFASGTYNGVTYANHALKGNYVLIAGGTGAGQTRTLLDYNSTGPVGNIGRTWDITPDATSVYIVVGNPHPVVDNNLAVTTGTNSDKTGYALTTGEHTNIGNDVVADLNLAAPGTILAGSAYAKLNAASSSTNPLLGLTTTNYGAGSVGEFLKAQLTNPVPLPADIVTAWQTATVDGTLTQKQLNAINAATALESDRTWNATTHTAVVTWYRRNAGLLTADKTRPIKTLTTVYASDNVQIVSQTTTLANLP